MIRFVKDILDVKNVLGMERLQPMPTPDAQTAADTIVLRSDAYDTQLNSIAFSGDLTITETQGGIPMVRVVDDSWDLQLHADIGTDILIQGNMLVANDFTHDITYISANNTIEDIRILGSPVQILDLRNAYAQHDFYIQGTTPLQCIYARCTNLAVALGFEYYFGITTYTGDIWINPYEEFAYRVMQAAQDAGWNVYRYE